MASWTYPIFAYSLSLAWGLRICILKSFQQIMIPQHENLLILSSQLDCITLKETHSSRSPRKVGRMQTPRSLNSKPCAFCRATDVTVFWASGPSPQAHSPPCSSHSRSCGPRPVRPRHWLSPLGPSTAVRLSLVHLSGSWEPQSQVSQIGFLPVASTDCLCSHRRTHPTRTPCYMCEKGRIQTGVASAG